MRSLLRRTLIFAFLPWAACSSAEPQMPSTTEVTLGMHRIQAEVAADAATQARGLGGRDGLPEGHGMVFPYARAGRPGFWMKDMRFDIDIVWIRGDRVVDIHHDVPFDPGGTEGPTVRPSEPADLVLEVTAGTARRLGWRVGDAVRVDPPVRPGRR